MLTAIHRDPFSVAPHVYRLAEGTTLADMVGRVRSLPEGWPRHEHDVITINGHLAPRALWAAIRPKAGVEVGFHAPPMGGDGGGKQILSLVASIGLVALSGGITSGTLLGGLTGAAAAGKATFLSRLIGAGVLIGGSMALSALAPTPSVPQGEDGGRADVGTASAQGNTLEPNAVLPRVVGTRKIYPPFLAEPLAYYDGQDEVVEAVVGLAGPHHLDDIRIADAEVEGMGGVEIETREGWPGQDTLRLVERYARTSSIRSELRGHVTREDAGDTLESPTGQIEDALPQPKVLSTRNAPDEYRIDINFPQGLFWTPQPTYVMRVPFRLRLRQKGAVSWTNLPEIHFGAAHVGEKRASIRLIWQDGEISAASAATSRGWVEGRINTPGQGMAPATSGWTADSYFDSGSGDDYVDGTNSGSTAVRNLIMSEHVAEIHLDRASFPAGQYEIEITRGYTFYDGSYNPTNYQLSTLVRDFFRYEAAGAARIFQTQEGMSDKTFIVRGISIWNASPVQKGGMALIAVKARNVNIEKLSVLASGYVRDWDGSGWRDWTTTSNPAPHMRDILGGLLNARPVPEDIIDDDGLVAWRAACTAAGYTVDAICEGLSLAEAANLVAGAGYAKPYQSEIWGVTRDYDRAADGPVQVFSPHNMQNFRWSKGFAKRPDGFRITFADVDRDYETRQIIHPPDAGLTEQVSYDGLVAEADCRARADYDLATTLHRSTFYDFDAPAEAIKCRRGSLIQVQHDMLTEFAGSGRIVDVEYDGSGDVTAVTLDNEPPAMTGPGWDDIGVNDWDDLDMGLIGLGAGVILRGNGVSVHACTVSGARIALDTPATLDDLGLDDLAILGPVGQEARRLIVFSMQPRADFVWTITAVDEAPEIWNG